MYLFCLSILHETLLPSFDTATIMNESPLFFALFPTIGNPYDASMWYSERRLILNSSRDQAPTRAKTRPKTLNSFRAILTVFVICTVIPHGNDEMRGFCWSARPYFMNDDCSRLLSSPNTAQQRLFADFLKKNLNRTI